MPQARRIGTLFAPAEVNSVVNNMVKAAARHDFEVLALSVNTSCDIPDTTLSRHSRRALALSRNRHGPDQ